MNEVSCIVDDVRRTAKSLACIMIVSGCVIYTWRRRNAIVKYAVIGPYATVSRSMFARMLQRFVIDKTRTNHRIDWCPMSSLLNAQPSRSSDNGHKVSGASRDGARSVMTNAISALGYSVFEISPGCRSVDQDHSTHFHYAVGDLQKDISYEVPGAKQVVMGIDIDYYLKDVSQFLGYPNPSIFYTFQPREVAGKDGDTPFRIKDNKIIYDVSGGSGWEHEVWDWANAGEYVAFKAPCTWVGRALSIIGLRKMMYQKIHHCRPFKKTPHRVIVWTVPQYSHWELSWLPSDLHARSLKRLVYGDARTPGWNSIVSITDEDILEINLGRAGEDATSTLVKKDYDVLMGLASAQSVTSRMVGMGYSDPRDLALVGQYYRKGTSENPECSRIGKPVGPLVHWPSAVEAEAPETSFRSYASPLVSDANMVPMIKRWETLSKSIDARVTMATNLKTPSRRYQTFAEEFVRLVVPIPHEGVPYELEHTAELLDKPSQTLAIKQVWETVDMPARKMIECFVKNEPTNKPGRIISSFPDMRFLLGLSSYTLSFRDSVLHAEHNQHWFCPGLTPNQIAAKVVDYCSSVDKPLEGDFNNLDGSVPEWAQRHVMNAVYHRYFGTQFRSSLTTFTDMLISCPARAKRFGFRYEAGVGVKSGSPTTCDLNTVLNAFLQYCAVRITLPELPLEDAYRVIGLAFGDDSLFDKQFGRAFTSAAEALGMGLKLEQTSPETGVTFLARVFPKPTESTTSFQDPLRTWRKLHLTARDPNVPLLSAAVDRLQGYLVTDGITPITGDYANMVVRNFLSQPGMESEEKRNTRKSYGAEKPYWLTSGGAWPQDEADIPAMFDTISARTGLSLESLRELQRHLRACTDVLAPTITINRDEEEVVYKDTLDAEAQPASGSVDLRQHQNDRANNHSRADQNAARIHQRSTNGTEQHAQHRKYPGDGRDRKRVFPNSNSGPQSPKQVGQQRFEPRGRTDGARVPVRSQGPGDSRPFNRTYRDVRADQEGSPGVDAGSGSRRAEDKNPQTARRAMPRRRSPPGRGPRNQPR